MKLSSIAMSTKILSLQTGVSWTFSESGLKIVVSCLSKKRHVWNIASYGARMLVNRSRDRV